MATGSPKQACRPGTSRGSNWRRRSRLVRSVGWVPAELFIVHPFWPAPGAELAWPSDLAEVEDSRAADEDAGAEHDKAAHDHLEGGAQELGVHVARPDPGDRPQLYQHHGECQGGGGAEVADEIGHRVADAAERRHESGDRAPQPGMAAPRQLAVVR